MRFAPKNTPIEVKCFGARWWQVMVRKPTDDDRLNHEFDVVLDGDFESFVGDVDTRLDVVNRIARALGDHGATPQMRVTRLVPGSITLCWTNSSLMTSSTCPLQVRFSKGARGPSSG